MFQYEQFTPVHVPFTLASFSRMKHTSKRTKPKIAEKASPLFTKKCPPSRFRTENQKKEVSPRCGNSRKEPPPTAARNRRMPAAIARHDRDDATVIAGQRTTSRRAAVNGPANLAGPNPSPGGPLNRRGASRFAPDDTTPSRDATRRCRFGPARRVALAGRRSAWGRVATPALARQSASRRRQRVSRGRQRSAPRGRGSLSLRGLSPRGRHCGRSFVRPSRPSEARASC